MTFLRYGKRVNLSLQLPPALRYGGRKRESYKGYYGYVQGDESKRAQSYSTYALTVIFTAKSVKQHTLFFLARVSAGFS